MSQLPAAESFGDGNNGVVGWLNIGATDPDTLGATGAANQLLTRTAMIAADPYIDYSSYDVDQDGNLSSEELSIVVSFAGNEAAV